jgi:hypothetical protein
MKRLKYNILSVLAVLFVVALFSLLAASFYNFGYKDGYCSGVNGATLGDSRFCNVDGKVVTIT